MTKRIPLVADVHGTTITVTCPKCGAVQLLSCDEGDWFQIHRDGTIYPSWVCHGHCGEVQCLHSGPAKLIGAYR